MTVTVAMMSSGLTARLMRRFDHKLLVVAGMSIMACGIGLLATAGTGTGYFPQLFFAYVISGLGAGTSFMPLLEIAMADVPAQDAGLGSGMVNLSMQGAGAVGVAVLGTLSTSHTQSLQRAGHSLVSSLSAGYQFGYLVAAGTLGAGIVIAIVAMRTSERQDTPLVDAPVFSEGGIDYEKVLA